MKGNDLAGVSAPRILIVFEGVLGFITGEGEEAFHHYIDEMNWLAAARCWSLNDLALAKLTDLCVRMSVNVEVATYAGPQEFADALEFLLCDQELVPIRRVIASTPQQTARRATFANDIISVYDPEPARSMAYGSKGRHLTSIHQLGILSITKHLGRVLIMLGFFDANKYFDEQALRFPATGNLVPLAAFRYLLLHTWWLEGEMYGWVTDGWTQQGKIASAMGTHKNTVSRALLQLEQESMITRRRRSAGRGNGRLPDEIYISWLDKYNT